MWDKSRNACEFKRTERRGIGDSITDNSFKSFSHEREQSKGVGVRSEIKKEEIRAHLYVDDSSFFVVVLNIIFFID